MFKRVIKEEYRVPADIGHLGEMRDFVTRAGRKYGVAERTINAFKLAIDEAGTNIIRHAYRDWQGEITIRMIIRDTNITVSLIDQGHSFDPRKVKDPDLQRYVDIGKKGGLGIFIIRRVIDDIDYRKTTEGNELRLTKNRDASSRHSFLMHDLSFTMKTRFSLVASGIFTALVLVVFFWMYSIQGNKVLRTQFESGRNLAKSLAQNCLDPLAKQETWETARIASEFQREHSSQVTEVLILDTSGVIQGARQTEWILEPYSIPSNAVQTVKDIFLYTLPDGKAVYDIVQKVVPEISGVAEPVGTIHYLLDKSLIDRQIRQAKNRTVSLFVLILVFGYASVFGLIYVTMSPFKKLANWVRAMGRDEIHDEMDFDTSDEIGEIAKAFNEITEKFRKSQVNMAEQERLQKEMQVAQEIQHTLLPSTFPDIEGFEIASYYEAAKEVGGDYFDFVEVDKETLGIVVADVSGKGVPGSLVMTMIRTALRTEARGNKNAAEVLASVNDFVINDMKRGMFVTVFYMVLDSHNRTINYASAGHNPMILYRDKTKKSYYLNPRGFPIGINLPDNTLFRNSIQSDTLKLQEGDVLICYTDGITEAMNPTRERFGEERFLSVIRQHGNLKVDPLVDRIRDEIKLFTESYAQSDDITMVAIREKMSADDVLFNLRNRLMKLVEDDGMTIKAACQTVGVSTSTYYKYKKRFQKMGVNGLKEKTIRADIEEKHIAIEDKTKLYDIIKEHPDWGAKRISEELGTEKYGLTMIDEKRIYEELVRARLNTKDLRLAFVERGGKGKRLKPPGTPFLALDGQILLDDKAKRRPYHAETIAEEDEKQRPHFELRVSQKPETAPEEEKEEEAPLLDQFLGLSDLGDAGGAPADGIEEPVEPPEVPGIAEGYWMGDHLEEGSAKPEDETSGERQSETGKKPLPDGEIPEEEMVSEDDRPDDGFTDLITNVLEISEDKQVPTPADERMSLDQILEMEDGGLSDTEAVGPVEDRITASIAGDLLGEQIGLVDEGGEPGETESDRSEGFIQMMEGLGFDRRTMLYQSQKAKGGRGSEAVDEAVKKRLLDSGLQFYKQGDYLKAVGELKKAIQKDPHFPEAYHCLGDAYFRLGEFDSAAEVYEKVHQMDPGNIHVLENLGVIFANRGDYKKAVWQWGEVLKHNPDRKDIIDRIKKMQKVIRQKYL